MNQTIKILIYCVLGVVIIFSINMAVGLSYSLKSSLQEEKRQETKMSFPKTVDCSCSSTNCKTHTFNGNWAPTDSKCFTSDKNCFYCCLGKEDLIK
jgi:hypothetical protein